MKSKVNKVINKQSCQKNLLRNDAYAPYSQSLIYDNMHMCFAPDLTYSISNLTAGYSFGRHACLNDSFLYFSAFRRENEAHICDFRQGKIFFDGLIPVVFMHIKKSSPLWYNNNMWSTSGRELTPLHPERISPKSVPPEVNRSKNTNRVPSFKDSYKAASERTRPQNLKAKGVSVMFYVGIDWADDHHDVYIVDEQGTEVDSFPIKHDSKGMCFLRDKIRELSSLKEQVLIAIETPKNLLVDFLLDEGYTVYAINPMSVDRYRERYRTSGARDDSFDAMVLANIIRTDRKHHRAIIPNSELARELKILTRDEQRLIRLKTKLLNQIQSCLKDYYPTALELFCKLDQGVTLDFLLKYPRPQKISLCELKKFLKKCSYPGADEKAEEIFEKLSGPQIFVEEFSVRAKSRMLITLVSQLKMLLPQLDEYQKEIERLFEQHPDSEIFKSLPGAGEKNAPRLLAEIGDNRERYSESNNLQCDAGTAPVTDKSGKTEFVRMRFACRKVFRNVVYQFAFSTLTQSAWARKFYDCQRAKGNTNTKALRSLGNKWLKIIFRMWQDGVAYDENRHLADIMRYQLNAPSAA